MSINFRLFNILETMVNIQPHIRNLFRGYPIPTDGKISIDFFPSNKNFFFCWVGQGQYKCPHCSQLLLFGTNRLNWMTHIKAEHELEFEKLVEELRLAKKVLNEAIGHIPNDAHDEVRFSTISK